MQSRQLFEQSESYNDEIHGLERVSAQWRPHCLWMWFNNWSLRRSLLKQGKLNYSTQFENSFRRCEKHLTQKAAKTVHAHLKMNVMLKALPLKTCSSVNPAKTYLMDSLYTDEDSSIWSSLKWILAWLLNTGPPDNSTSFQLTMPSHYPANASTLVIYLWNNRY